jgi:hypothetical protein
MLTATNAQFRFAPPEGPNFFESLGWRCVQVESILKAAVPPGPCTVAPADAGAIIERHSSKGGYSGQASVCSNDNPQPRDVELESPPESGTGPDPTSLFLVCSTIKETSTAHSSLP